MTRVKNLATLLAFALSMTTFGAAAYAQEKTPKPAEKPAEAALLFPQGRILRHRTQHQNRRPDDSLQGDRGNDPPEK